MGRRLMYFWTIMQRDEAELVKKVYNSQKLLPVRNDWVVQIQSDLSDCDITLSEGAVRSMKKETFKNLVKSKIRNLSNTYLVSLRSKHSKSEKLMLDKSIKKYLISEKMTTDKKKVLFSLKTRAVNVKTNYSSNLTNYQCRLCHKLEEKESEIHVMKCEKILSDNQLKNELATISYEDIFGTVDKQISAAKVWKKVLRVWNIKIDAVKQSPSGPQVHLPDGLSASFPCTAPQTVDPPSPDVSNCIDYDFGV